jgi:hypothetical protein
MILFMDEIKFKDNSDNITNINANSKSFDFLIDDTEHYSVSDLREIYY